VYGFVSSVPAMAMKVKLGGVGGVMAAIEMQQSQKWSQNISTLWLFR
jgi:hypothetical protein